MDINIHYVLILEVFLDLGYNKEMDKIEFISTVEGLDKIEECIPKPAKHYIPKWFKDIPSHGSTVKYCPSFPDYFSLGYVVPMWTNSKLVYKSETGFWKWEVKDEKFKYTLHSNQQMLDYVTARFNGVDGQVIFKAECPWMIITPPGWSVLQLPLFYHFNQEWSVMPGVIDTDIHNEINQQILYHGNGKEINIKRGDPFVLYIPFKKDDIKLVRYQNKTDYKMFYERSLKFENKPSPNGLYRKLQRKKNKNG
jgi:hypothetical protein